MIKIKLLIIIVLGILVIPNFRVLAVESSPSAKPSNSILDKLNQIKATAASKAAEMKKDVDQQLSNKIATGSVTSIDDTKIYLDGDPRQVVLTNQYTEISSDIISASSKGKKISSSKLSVKDLASDDYIIAMGDLDDQKELVAKKILRIKKPDWVAKKVLMGQITAVSPVTIKTKQASIIKLLTSGSTDFFLGKEESSIVDARINNYLIARGLLNKEGSVLNAEFVYFIPAAGHTTPDKVIPTPSPVTATPSAKPKK